MTENILSDPARITDAMYEDFLETSGRGWVVESGDGIAAFCYANRTDASIQALFVRPGDEGRGFGAALLRQAVDWLFEVGHERIVLTTGADTRADRFYAAQGWLRQPISAVEIGYSLTQPRTGDPAAAA